MARHARCTVSVCLGAVAVAVATACGGSATSPHQPGQCPAYSGGLGSGDSLYGLFQLVSYCIDTLPAHGPPGDTGHVTLKRATPADSLSAVFASQGQPPIPVAGTYTTNSDSIHVTGQVSTPLGPAAAVFAGRFLLRHDTLSVSGTLTVTGTSGRPLSFVGRR